nr:MAG TPA: hypothetical protein [Caudoviricetes sp.]
MCPVGLSPLGFLLSGRSATGWVSLLIRGRTVWAV